MTTGGGGGWLDEARTSLRRNRRWTPRGIRPYFPDRADQRKNQFTGKIRKVTIEL